MERINTYNKEVKQFLEEVTNDKTFYWRYQESRFQGLIPVGHTSYERSAIDEEDAEYIEEGCSCYDNPYQLLEYIYDDMGGLIERELKEDGKDNFDVILFSGIYKGTGLDSEDIVEVRDEEDVYYSMPINVFLKFCKNSDNYINHMGELKECYNSKFDWLELR